MRHLVSPKNIRTFPELIYWQLNSFDEAIVYIYVRRKSEIRIGIIRCNIAFQEKSDSFEFKCEFFFNDAIFNGADFGYMMALEATFHSSMNRHLSLED